MKLEDRTLPLDLKSSASTPLSVSSMIGDLIWCFGVRSNGKLVFVDMLETLLLVVSSEALFVSSPRAGLFDGAIVDTSDVECFGTFSTDCFCSAEISSNFDERLNQCWSIIGK